MTWAEAEIVKGASNLRTQAIAKALIGRETALVIRLKGGKYSSTDEPLGERILYDINYQFVGSDTFARFFHDSMVIGLRYKCTTKSASNEVQKVGEIVHYFPE